VHSLEENVPRMWAHELDHLLHLGLVGKAPEAKAIPLPDVGLLLLRLLASISAAGAILLLLLLTTKRQHWKTLEVTKFA
jgi:hypothetical protein